MAKVVVPSEFLALLGSSELIEPDRLARIVEKLDLDNAPTAKEAARRLVKSSVLTAFQAERLLHGRYRGFFIGDYRVQNLLGSGGMGSIFQAIDTKTGDRVALKVLNDAAKNDAGMLARFELEAAAGGRLNHPDIVRTYKVDQTSHVAYVVMEYVEGINLHELTVLHGTKKWPQVCDFILQAARGLHHAHQHGVIHRDVKPSNLLVATDGRVRILDFGLALLDGATSEDEFSLAMIFGHDCLGTADYMPPEQSRDSHEVGPRADVYSLGCTFYYALTGSPPFAGENNAQKIAAHKTKRLPDPRKVVPDLPDEVLRIVVRMMAKDPADRFGSMAEVVDALAPFAKRGPLEFDFDRVIRIRANDTRRRMARDRAEQRRSAGRSSLVIGSGSVTGSTMSGVLSSSAALRTSRASTVVGGDTRPDNSPHREEFDEPVPTPSAASSAMLLAEKFEQVPPDHRLVRADGTSVLLTHRRFVLGRELGCDLQTNEKGISARHCQLEFEAGTWSVRDLGSKNGIAVNGMPVKERVLRHGDRISLAGVEQFRFEHVRTAEGDRHRGRRTWLLVAAVFAIVAVVGGLWWALS
jgi:eukaryotic-like serine/threonine-protein kinase